MIVHITDCFHPRLGGIEIQVGELVAAQRASGETVHVITATPVGDAECGRDYGYPVHRVVARLPWQLPVHPRAGTHLVRLLRQLRPDVVHVHIGSVSPFAWSAVVSALRCGLPTVVTVHSMWGPSSRTMYRFLDRLSGWGHAPLVVTAVSTVVSGLIARTRPHVIATPVPNGISAVGWRSAVPREPRRADEPVHIVAIGRLAPRKQPIGLLRLLRAARLRIDPDLPVRVTVAGAGPALAVMKAYLRRHSMTEWVHLAGRLDREGVHALLSTADIFVNPTVRESFGIATLEARTAGVPVIARSGNGVAEFIGHGQEGLLCASPGEFVEAIVHLVQDTGARERIREHNLGTEPVHCTWPAVTAAFSRCYDRAIALAGSPERGDVAARETAAINEQAT